MSGFLIIFGITYVIITLMLHVLGATFDDGYNFVIEESDCGRLGFGDMCEPYETNFNDYQFMEYFWVTMLANLRTAIGDL